MVGEQKAKCQELDRRPHPPLGYAIDKYAYTCKYIPVMPNKTIYIRDADIPLWELAQAELGESISALFVKFLREKLPMVERIHSRSSFDPVEPGRRASLRSDVCPVGPTGSGGAMKPHYVKGWDHLVRFLRDIGFTDKAAHGIESDLKEQPSVSVRMNLARPLANTNFYRLHFRADWVDAGKQSWPKVIVTGEPLSADSKRWSATFHDPDRCMSVVSQCIGSPASQLAAIRRSVLEGQEVELGGSGGGVQFVVREDQLMQMGLTPVE